MKINKILLIHGPNLNLLGTREPDIYGKESQDQLFAFIKSSFPKIEFIFFQSNHEGEIIDTIHDERHWADRLIINPGAFSHYSYAIRDAISSISIPTIEVHLSDIHKREDFRKISVIKSVCIGQISAKGKNSYVDGLMILLERLNKNE